VRESQKKVKNVLTTNIEKKKGNKHKIFEKDPAVFHRLSFHLFCSPSLFLPKDFYAINKLKNTVISLMLLILLTGHLPLSTPSQNTNSINHIFSLIPCLVFSQTFFPKATEAVCELRIY